MDVVLAVDLGGSGLRAALIDADGATIATHRIIMPAPTPVDGRSEMDPEIWWNGLLAAGSALADLAPDHFAHIRAVAISAFTRSQVMLYREGRSLRPALLWNDTRAGETLGSLKANCRHDHPETADLNAFHPLARLWWLKSREPASFNAINCVLEPKDFLNFRLTGQRSGDTVSSARMIAAMMPGEQGQSLFSQAGMNASTIPPMLGPRQIMGRISRGCAGVFARLAGIPVIAMANDTWASVIGLGAMRPGFGYNLSGTTEVLGLCAAIPLAADGLMSVDWGDGLSQLGGPSLAGGDTLVWLLGLLRSSRENPAEVGPALDMLLAQPRAAGDLLFLPYLQGERVPFWDADRRGAWIGINRQHGAVDMAYSALEGIAFLNRLVLERAENALGRPVTALRFGGGGAASAIWCQIKADVLGREITVPSGDDHGLRGAAIVAFAALGRFADLEAGQEAFVSIARRYLPDAEQRRRYDRLYALFREADAALAPISHALARMSGVARNDAGFP